MAPEVIRDEGGGISWRKADIWSLGCTTLEMTTGKAPWKQFNNPVTILYHLACQDTLPEYPSPASFEVGVLCTGAIALLLMYVVSYSLLFRTFCYSW
jgi:serine/threonine protein kinase